MKRIIALAAALLTLLTLLCSCKKDMGRLNYNYDMSKVVELDSFSVEVDPTSDNYKEYYSERVSELLVAELTEGKVEEGDIANIDYVGKKDGVAFDGGTANGYDLEIGSDSFIDGFEDGLIGKEIGSTVDLNLTFPESYGNADLAGQDVVFTVKINSVQHTFSELNDENAKTCGFDSAAEIEADAVKYATEGAAWDIVYENAKVEYPKKETEVFYSFLLSNLDIQMQNSYGITLEEYVEYAGTTMDEVEQTVRESEDLTSLSQNYAVSYYIIDKCEVKLDKDRYNTLLEEYGEETVNAVGKEYIEATVVFEQAMKIVGEKAILKK